MNEYNYKRKSEYKEVDTKRINKNIKVIILGGMGEVGKNCYALEIYNDIFIIDYGVLFPSEEYIGVDYIIPNFTYLKQNSKKIRGLFITHGHEDHIGGIAFLLKTLSIKTIYASKMSRFLIEKKLKEHKLDAKIEEINEQATIKFGSTTLHTFHQTHSIPNSMGLFFETPKFNLVTTGDFKIDFSPAGENKTDFHRIVYLANKGVDLLLADSTNSLKDGFSESSSEIGDNLKVLIKEAEGRILFTTFASHINRVQKIVEGAIEDKRKICVLGRSMKNNIKIGMRAGYIKLKPSDIIDLKYVTQYRPEEVCIISTGSQGEELAALSRIASGLNPHLELSEEDTVVFASNPIPGNRYNIGKVIDRLYKTKCKVIVNTVHFKTHTSGHASKEEQKLMISLFNPKNFLPIHGNYHMLLEHKKTAMDVGIKEENIYILDNGDALLINSGKKIKVQNRFTQGGSMFVSGNNINVSLKDSNMNQIASNGLLIVSLLVNNSKKLISYPQITTRGFVIISEELDFLKQIQKYFIKIYNQNTDLDEEKLKDLLIKKTTKFIYNKTGKTPFLNINVIKYSPKIETKSIGKIKMANFVDMHVHLTNSKYGNDIEHVIESDKITGVKKILLIGCDEEEIKKSINLVSEYEEYMFLAIGFHPTVVTELTEDKIKWLENLLKTNKKIIALGEIGLDYYWHPEQKELQKKYFVKQIKLAKKLNMPIIVHARESLDDCFSILEQEDYFYGIMHSFAGDYESAKKFINKGMYISISGPVTFKNGYNQKDVVKNISLDKLLVETDGPYLTPEPYRGKRNESKYLEYIIKEIANIKEVEVQKVESQIYKNSIELLKRYANEKI